MGPTTVTSLALLVAFVLPGFVTVLIQERTFKAEVGSTQLDRLLRALHYSGWTYLLLALVAWLVPGLHRNGIEDFIDRRDNDPAALGLLAAAIVIVPSAFIGFCTQRWAEWDRRIDFLKWARLNPYHDIDSGWHFFFSGQVGTCYLRIKLTDGEEILGYYGECSFAAYSRDDRDLYLEHCIERTEDGGFGKPQKGSLGVWVPTSEVVSIQFYNPGNESGNDNVETAGEN